MKLITIGQKKLLSQLNLAEFKEQCLEDVKSLGLGEAGYPQDPERYEDLVEDCYKEGTESYHLTTGQEIKALLMAAHIGGKEFAHNKDVVRLLANKEITNRDKLTFLRSYIYDVTNNGEHDGGK